MVVKIQRAWTYEVWEPGTDHKSVISIEPSPDDCHPHLRVKVGYADRLWITIPEARGLLRALQDVIREHGKEAEDA